ncbi:ribbon-helix-helix protein, CopG family [Shuttleworthella satelles]|uniref:Ribbon-helix-helix protein, CopG family n=1 Tax=Shuttleworthella satelles DSM 14600 TaxID=626523 RepID=C4GAU7_9FIRM|nr:Ribbon-helix-helix protein, CopG family [Shuttleworthia satelles DSM 14600]
MRRRGEMESDAKQITLRIPEEIYEALKEEAEKMGVSVNQICIHAIRHWLDQFCRENPQNV